MALGSTLELVDVVDPDRKALEIAKNFVRWDMAKANINIYRDWETDRKSTRLNSSHSGESRMPSSA